MNTYLRGGAALLVVVMLSVLGSCRGSSDVAYERAQRARDSGGAITVAAAWPWSVRNDGLYWEGMKMAMDEVNASGGIHGRPLRIIREDDHESVNEGRLVAQRLADNPDIVAVIGHLNSHVTIPAADIYDAAGLLMLTPGSTNPELTQNGHRLVFRSVNNDEDIASQMVGFAASRGYRRVSICYVRNAYGLGLANAFEQRARELQIDVVDRQTYDPTMAPNPMSFQRLVAQWKDLEFDALFLAGMAPQAGFLIKQIRADGIDVPILGGDALDTPELISSAGDAAEGVIVASVFHPDDPRPVVQRFNADFRAIYGREPDSWAARGYEAVRLLSDGMIAAESAVPDDVARHFRTMEAWPGLTGTFSFRPNGDVSGKSIIKTIVENGRFEFFEDRPALAERHD